MSTAPTKQPSALSLFGVELRHHRLKAGLTLEQFGAEVGYSYGLISQVEHGKRVPQPELAKGADRVFGTDGLFERFQEYVSRLGTPRHDLREYYRREPSATSIQNFESALVPGLLQTESYARALVRASRPSPTADEAEARVATRMTRQDILDQDAPPTLWAIIGEGALHVRVGSSAIMAQQMEHLLGQARRPNVTVQVLSFRAGLGASEGVPFLVADFRDGPPAFLVNVPGVPLHIGSTVDAVATYRPIFDYLRAAALPEEDSLELIEVRRKAWHGTG